MSMADFSTNRLARTELFRKGIDRIRNGMREHRIALMCAEKDPLQCHRTILVARHLVEEGIAVEHIREDGRLESHDEALSRLLAMLKLSTGMSLWLLKFSGGSVDDYAICRSS